MNDQQPFWKSKSLREMSSKEWESLCDGCAKCCLNKLEDWETGEVFWTSIACTLLDDQTCKCKDYANRQQKVPDCIRLSLDNIETLTWLPATCAYRLINESQDLYWWHHLVSGDADTVHLAGISVQSRTLSEDDIPVAEYEKYIIDDDMKDIN